MNSPYLILFDCDGTLVDSQHQIVSAMKMTFAEHGYEDPDRADIVSTIGLPLECGISRIAPELKDQQLTEAAKTYRKCFANIVMEEKDAPMFPGAKETLIALNQNSKIVIGMATGKSMRGVNRLLERENIFDFFVTLQTSDNAPPKPGPGMVDKAMQETGIDANHTLVIGDTTYDMEMAKNAQVKALAVSWGYHSVENLEKIGVEKTVYNFDQLLEYVEFFVGSEK